ncbi:MULTISPECIES: ketoacyl-ACP synthase III [Staphylococcus]|jgi:3-oxoacyl-[acyl-carrier-protein] synthase-3|uniref:Beta-ketoacyl-[acyl-carrier-protein] synthase III 2 n=1 Tax=Staphylococcus epidermidis (strain ATCC 12228 / FDA PCI 1200) TaxID=176280 RepID=FABH2_STAES|nr:MULTISPECIES: ketoacyl-ACP synthase III [Staphylococcus]Q8CUB8.1 RecName: Full=Beta-ketoacyl-[acyl-carrier-protein] synthase III 2; Short=Beta-ketoacyl-ACP synthase III 2; Short=KAS III 2; AltName: Full=3-oxoacyl-[acyl-carrier-protein] synthase 3 2; AltName: Full=3-oxoacyl-[acyl-carrier-protein] synthase III 2 [Staphylococcus epidermidis ATCC 12228]AAO06192.1 3-oxoacyl-[acyl-carrier-protein] synthase [Staphylococcus epidermidis ATCC 12228]KAB1898150.1 ketoacyl-ACP synthase III [Staphylococcus
MQSFAKITAQGTYVPEKVMDNNDFEKIVETSDEWIQQRTGIIERRIADENEYTSDLSYKAVLDLQEKYQVDLTDVDMIINTTLTPDYKTPSVASYVQAQLGLKNAGAIDINAACAGFTYGLNLANGLITSGQNKKILVIGSETLSKITDYNDRSTCILFGDGAGAFLVEYDKEEMSFIASNAGSDGLKGHNLYCTELSEEMFSDDLENHGYIVQNGRGVYKWAVGNVPNIIHEVLNQSNYSIEDLNWFVPHSANARMIESICEKANIETDKALKSLKYYGNTSSATIPLSIDLAIKEGKIKKDDLILLVGFGGGLAYASTLIRWTI